MRNLTIYRIPLVLADLVEFMDIYQHDMMRILFNCAARGDEPKIAIEQRFVDELGSMNAYNRDQLWPKVDKAFGAVLHMFGELSSRIRMEDWIDAEYIPAGPDTFMVLTSVFDVKALTVVLDGLQTSLKTTVLTSRYFVGPELELLNQVGYGEGKLIEIVDMVASGRGLLIVQQNGEDDSAYALRTQLLTSVRSLIHAKLCQVTYFTGEHYTLKGVVDDRTLIVRLYPHLDAPAF